MGVTAGHRPQSWSRAGWPPVAPSPAILLLILSASTLDSGDTKDSVIFPPISILAEPTGRITTPALQTEVKFACVLEPPGSTTLKCVCDSNEKVVHINRRTQSSLWLEIRSHKNLLTRLELLLCSPAIGEQAIESMGSQMVELVISGAKKLTLEVGSINTSSTNLSLTVEKVGLPWVIQQGTLGSNVAALTLDQVWLQEFSSNDLGSIKPGAVVSIANSRVEPVPLDVPLEPLRVQSLHFKNVDFGNVNNKFLRVSASRSVVFDNVTMDVLTSGAVDVLDAETVLFLNCRLGFFRGRAVEASAFSVVFESTVLNEPQKQSLMGLVGINDTSVLTLKNVTLEDPSRGTLLTKFPQVRAHTIKVDRCKCDLITDLLDDQDLFYQRFVKVLTKDEMRDILVNETVCRPRDPEDRVARLEWVRPDEACSLLFNINEDPGYGLVVVGFLVLTLVLFCLAAAGAYRWNEKARRRIKMVKNWSIVVPGIGYKESALVQFNEQVQYISPPESSTVLSTTSGVEGPYDEVTGGGGSQRGSFPEAAGNLSIGQDLHREGQVRPFQRKNTMAKPRELLQAKEWMDSMVVHDDLEEEYCEGDEADQNEKRSSCCTLPIFESKTIAAPPNI